LGKAYGMIACTTLIAAGLWITNIGDSPSQAVAGVENAGTSPSLSTNRSVTGHAPVTGYSSNAVRPATERPIVRGQSPDQGDSQFGGTNGPVPFDTPNKRSAIQLLKSARKELQASRFDIARQKAMEAQQLNAKYAVFEDNPQLVLSEIERRTGGLTFAPQQNSVVTAQGQSFPSENPRIQQTGANTAPATSGTVKDQALGLLREARADMSAGRLAAAREKALKAQGFNITYGLFDDNPELLLEDLTRLAATQPASTPSGSSEKQIAQGLVKQARQSLLAGKYDDAYQKASAAQQLNVAYTLLEDRPETVLQDLQIAMAGDSSAPTANIASATKPAAPTNGESVRARELVTQARTALKSGRIDEAWAKASAASQMNVAFELFEDTPQRVMSEIERMQSPATPNKPNVAQAAAVAPPAASSNMTSANQATQLVREARMALRAGQFETAKQKALMADQLNATYGPVDDRPELVLRDLAEVTSNPFGGPVNPAAYQPTAGTTSQPSSPSAMTAANVSPVYPASMTADQMFEAGLSQMTNGNMAAARDAFLTAYRQQEQLDPRRRQQLQDFLRELAPSGQQGLQLTAGNSYDSAESGQLNLVDQQRAIAYDRLRSDVMNSIFKAERLREKDPEQALSVLDQALASVENSTVGDEASKNLINSIRRTQTSVNAYKEQQAPLLNLKRRNAENLSIVESRIETQIRVEQELASLVDEFNTLMDQRRYAEAEVIAKQAVELDPQNPVTEVMKWKSRFARRIAFNNQLKDDKEQNFIDVLNDVELSALNPVHTDPIAYMDAQDWKELSDRRAQFGGPDNKVRTDVEKKIEQSLSRQISLHFDNAPLTEVMKHIANLMGITVYVDGPALSEVGIEASTPVSIDVDGIMLKSALNLILKPIELGYNIEDEVLKITNQLRQQGKLLTRSYPVADLVVPLSNFQPNMGMMGPYIPDLTGGGPSGSVIDPGATNGFNMGMVPGMMQVPDNGTFGQGASPFGGTPTTGGTPQRTTTVNFNELSDLITTTVEPDTWAELNGIGSLMSNESTLSLVIRQTQQVHDEVADLLGQLRRLQDLQVTIEVRFITVADEFFERIGVDFDFNVQDNVNNDDAGAPPFGSPGIPDANNNNANNQGGATGGGSFDPQDNALPNLDNWRTSIVGLTDGSQSFSDDLDIGFRQGSFDLGVPEFVNTDLSAGASMGFAILSDIEAFFFINAAQGDSRSNIMFAPKVTLFNGQSAFVGDFSIRPFVTGYRPIVSVGSVGFEPIISQIPEGVFMGVAAVISADRRYVRLSVSPNFTAITDIQQFSVPGGAVGNLGGVNVGNNGGGANNGGANNGGANNANNGGSDTTLTIQQPITAIVTVQTTVSVPDGGTVLLGGVKTLSEGRNMAGVPILNKMPYLSRLFKNTGVGRSARSRMLMVTPRIIIQEEEEMLLGIPQS
jgi:general secretion pathway protein D